MFSNSCLRTYGSIQLFPLFMDIVRYSWKDNLDEIYHTGWNTKSIWRKIITRFQEAICVIIRVLGLILIRRIFSIATLLTTNTLCRINTVVWFDILHISYSKCFRNCLTRPSFQNHSVENCITSWQRWNERGSYFSLQIVI